MNKTFASCPIVDTCFNIDDAPMLRYICERLEVGHVNENKDGRFVNYYVTSKNDLLKIFTIFDKYLLIRQSI